MADTSSSLSLPFILPNQAQKHVTHNEALRILDVVTQLAVISDDQTTPPGTPSDGARYIVGDAATGDWSGRAGEVALFENSAWRFFVPRAGWSAWVSARETLIVHDGADWIDLDSDELQDIESFGLGMTSLPTAPFSAKLNAALWTALYQADGGTGSCVSTLNKENSTDDLGFVFQQNFQTRGLFGLFGSDRLRLSTSPDGAGFFDGLSIDTGSGIVDQPNLPRFKGTTSFDNYCAANSWITVAINTTEFNDQNTFDAGTSAFTAPVDGTYVFGGGLTFRENTSTLVGIAGRLIRNGTEEISGSRGEITGPHISERTNLNIQGMALLNAGDTVELQGRISAQDGYFLAGNTAFWGYKVG
ncbi:DUF2793 domain-containing protein [uncultured Roseobacter sp.]|uniref:DUF2793 domain-containing protein n=1 Tax=uncultured Roseobacter sp. TaxID=114847 RepID=UPI0026161937|nr:DUF2793 domain-containing protein [uncultured Roseobacter sp.]